MKGKNWMENGSIVFVAEHRYPFKYNLHFLHSIRSLHFAFFLSLPSPLNSHITSTHWNNDRKLYFYAYTHIIIVYSCETIPFNNIHVLHFRNEGTKTPFLHYSQVTCFLFFPKKKKKKKKCLSSVLAFCCSNDAIVLSARLLKSSSTKFFLLLSRFHPEKRTILIRYVYIRFLWIK